MSAQFYVGTRIKEMKDLSKPQKWDTEFLSGLLSEYETKYATVPEYNDRAQKVRVMLANAEMKAGEEEDEMSVEAKFVMAQKLLPNLKKHYDAQKTATREVFLVVDEPNKLGALIKQSRSVKETIRHFIGMNVIAQKIPMLAPQELGDYADIWFDYEPPVDFETFGGFSEDKWCLGRCLYRPSAEPGDFPTWQKFLGRMNDPAGFAAWVYGVASKRYKGRQVLWLYGKHGEDGKTYIQKLIAACLFPNVSAPMVNSALNGDAARFMGAEFEGKTLAYWDDCNNQKALFMEAVKQLSAGDTGNVARIEAKGAAVYNGQLETRLWINSNYTPMISQDNFVTSRLLFITLEKLDEVVNPNIGEAFRAEMSAFLNWAKKMYESRCKDDYKIEQPKEVLDAIQDLGDEYEQKHIDIFNNWFEPTTDPKEYITASRVSAILKNEGITENTKIKDFYIWLERRHDGKRRNTKKDGKPVIYVEGFKEIGDGVREFITRNPKKGGFTY